VRSAPALALTVRPSVLLAAAVAATTLAALAAVLGCGVALPLKAPLALVALLLGVRAARQLQSQSGLRLLLQEDGLWRVLSSADVGDDDQRYRLVEGSALGPLVTLRLVASGGPVQRIVLLPDCADADELRRLRVWLRHGASIDGGRGRR
jgi:hypothetical protein